MKIPKGSSVSKELSKKFGRVFNTKETFFFDIGKDYKKISKGFRMIQWLEDTKGLSKEELQQVINKRKKVSNVNTMGTHVEKHLQEKADHINKQQGKSNGEKIG